jgi:Skp family chaperone for outer membrane proteins
MRRVLTAFVAASTLSLCAQDAAPRFAFFSISMLVEKSVKARKIFTELEVTKGNLESKLKTKGEEGQKMQAQLQSGSLSDEGREKLQRELSNLELEFKKLQQDSQADLQKVQQKVFKQLSDVAGPIVIQLAKEQKLQVVFSDSAQQIISWADDAWIKGFTEEVAKRLDATGDAAAAKPAAAEKKPAAPAKKN